MKTSWYVFAFIICLPVIAVMTEVFGGEGSIIAFLLLPVAWILWVNLREHWWPPEDRDDR